MSVYATEVCAGENALPRGEQGQNLVWAMNPWLPTGVQCPVPMLRAWSGPGTAPGLLSFPPKGCLLGYALSSPSSCKI